MTTVKTFSRRDVSEHNTNRSAWIVIGNKIYDVTKFLDEHPGGCEVLLEQAGGDGTEAFEDVGHSTDARAMKEEFYVGDIIEEEKTTYSYDKKTWKSGVVGDNKQRGEGSSLKDSIIWYSIVALIVALVYYLINH